MSAMRTFWISLISLSVGIAVGIPPAAGAVPDAPGITAGSPDALALAPLPLTHHR